MFYFNIFAMYTWLYTNKLISGKGLVKGLNIGHRKCVVSTPNIVPLVQKLKADILY